MTNGKDHHDHKGCNHRCWKSTFHVLNEGMLVEQTLKNQDNSIPGKEGKMVSVVWREWLAIFSHGNECGQGMQDILMEQTAGSKGCQSS